MPFVTATFRVSEELARELASGGQLFGHITEANSGRVVKWLTPIAVKSTRAIRGNRWIAIGAIGIAAAAVGTIYVYKRFNRKARLASQLAKVDRTVQATLREHPTELSRDDLCRIRASIDDFLAYSEKRGYGDVNLELPEDARRTLVGLAEALRLFSTKLHTLSNSSEAVPVIETSSKAADLVPLLAAIRSQIEYQDRNWPAA